MSLLIPGIRRTGRNQSMPKTCGFWPVGLSTANREASLFEGEGTRLLFPAYSGTLLEGRVLVPTPSGLGCALPSDPIPRRPLQCPKGLRTTQSPNAQVTDTHQAGGLQQPMGLSPCATTMESIVLRLKAEIFAKQHSLVLATAGMVEKLPTAFCSQAAQPHVAGG